MPLNKVSVSVAISIENVTFDWLIRVISEINLSTLFYIIQTYYQSPEFMWQRSIRLQPNALLIQVAHSFESSPVETSRIDFHLFLSQPNRSPPNICCHAMTHTLCNENYTFALIIRKLRLGKIWFSNYVYPKFRFKSFSQTFTVLIHVEDLLRWNDLVFKYT